MKKRAIDPTLKARRAAYVAERSAALVADYMRVGWERAEAESAARRTYSAAFVRSIIPR